MALLLQSNSWLHVGIGHTRRMAFLLRTTSCALAAVARCAAPPLQSIGCAVAAVNRSLIPISCAVAAVKLSASRLRFNQSPARLAAVMRGTWRISCVLAAVKLGARRPRFNQSAALLQQTSSAHSAFALINQLHVGISHTQRGRLCFHQPATWL